MTKYELEVKNMNNINEKIIYFEYRGEKFIPLNCISSIMRLGEIRLNEKHKQLRKIIYRDCKASTNEVVIKNNLELRFQEDVCLMIDKKEMNEEEEQIFKNVCLHFYGDENLTQGLKTVHLLNQEGILRLFSAMSKKQNREDIKQEEYIARFSSVETSVRENVFGVSGETFENLYVTAGQARTIKGLVLALVDRFYKVHNSVVESGNSEYNSKFKNLKYKTLLENIKQWVRMMLELEKNSYRFVKFNKYRDLCNYVNYIKEAKDELVLKELIEMNEQMYMYRQVVDKGLEKVINQLYVTKNSGLMTVAESYDVFNQLHNAFVGDDCIRGNLNKVTQVKLEKFNELSLASLGKTLEEIKEDIDNTPVGIFLNNLKEFTSLKFKNISNFCDIKSTGYTYKNLILKNRERKQSLYMFQKINNFKYVKNPRKVRYGDSSIYHYNIVEKSFNYLEELYKKDSLDISNKEKERLVYLSKYISDFQPYLEEYLKDNIIKVINKVEFISNETMYFDFMDNDDFEIENTRPIKQKKPSLMDEFC